MRRFFGGKLFEFLLTSQSFALVFQILFRLKLRLQTLSLFIHSMRPINKQPGYQRCCYAAYHDKNAHDHGQ